MTNYPYFGYAHDERKRVLKELRKKERIDRIAELEAERDEAKMQSLADLGQAQEAYEAQLKAEAQLERFRVYMVDIAIDYINNCSEGYMKFANKKMEEMKDEV